MFQKFGPWAAWEDYGARMADLEAPEKEPERVKSSCGMKATPFKPRKLGHSSHGYGAARTKEGVLKPERLSAGLPGDGGLF